MNSANPTGADWSPGEIDLIVADYFEMLGLELAGKPYVKAHRNSALQELTKRSRGSIEFKHQNISAVLQSLGRPWIIGYKPMANFQNALLAGVERYFDHHVDVALPDLISTKPQVREMAQLFVAPPPARQDQLTTPHEALNRLVRKFDPALKDERNRKLGRQGEAYIVEYERLRLVALDRVDLASKVRWVSEEDGDGAGYDIGSYNHDGSERLIEVKTTNGAQATPFYLSENELSFSNERPEVFRLVRLYDFFRAPKAFELIPPLSDAVNLHATNYRASFN